MSAIPPIADIGDAGHIPSSAWPTPVPMCGLGSWWYYRRARAGRVLVLFARLGHPL